MSALVASPCARAPHGAWRRTRIGHIEDLGDAVLGAGLEAVQMSAATVSGTLVHHSHEGVLFGSGLIEGRVTLRGSLSKHQPTLGVALGLEGRSRHWLNDVGTGAVGVFCAGGDHDALYDGRSFYLAATLSEEHLLALALAEAEGVMLDVAGLRRTGLHPRPMAPDDLATLRRCLLAEHRGGVRGNLVGGSLEARILECFLRHLGREPRVRMGLPAGRGPAPVVARARAWIEANLDEPITISAIAGAAGTSRRSLHRAFLDILDESPQAYVRRLRLHRIRRGLALDAADAPTIASLANQWGIGELGRLAGRYRALFGELPSETIRRSRPEAAILAQTA